MSVAPAASGNCRADAARMPVSSPATPILVLTLIATRRGRNTPSFPFSATDAPGRSVAVGSKSGRRGACDLGRPPHDFIQRSGRSAVMIGVRFVHLGQRIARKIGEQRNVRPAQAGVIVFRDDK